MFCTGRAVICSSRTTITHPAVLHGWITKTLERQFRGSSPNQWRLVQRNQKTRVPVRPSWSIRVLLLLSKPIINTVCVFSILHHIQCHDIHYIHCDLKDAFRVKWHKLWLSALNHWRFYLFATSENNSSVRVCVCVHAYRSLHLLLCCASKPAPEKSFLNCRAWKNTAKQPASYISVAVPRAEKKGAPGPSRLSSAGVVKQWEWRVRDNRAPPLLR